MPKPRTLSVSKQCEDCGQSSPVACRQCMHCKADFYSQALEGGDYSPKNLALDDVAEGGGAGGERRRSERGRKREKPDYYDSLECENKRKAERQTSGSKGTPNKGTLGMGRRERLQGRSPRLGGDNSPTDSNDKSLRKSKDKGIEKRHHSSSNSGRAMLSWRKGGDRDDRDEEGVKRKKKKKKERDGAVGSSGGKTTGTDINTGKTGGKSNSSETGDGSCVADGENLVEEDIHMMDELASAEKVIHCQVSLMEINRKLCAVIGQPC